MVPHKNHQKYVELMPVKSFCIHELGTDHMSEIYLPGSEPIKLLLEYHKY